MKTIEFIIPTFNRCDELMAMLSSIVCQSSSGWRIAVMVDGSKPVGLSKIINYFNDPRIRVVYTDKRYNDWGHTPRELGKQSSTADYIIMGGDDNYYTPNLLKELSVYTEEDIDFIYWDMVHSHYNYQYFKCEPRTHAIDMGAFCIKTSLAQQIPLGTNFAADGDYVETFKKKFPTAKMKKIEKILFVHN
jgi:glycosyltransferase involved in cell wall biosynthesis